MIKVMIIEDEEGIRKLIRKIVETQDGFSVVAEAAGFAEAITAFSQYCPDVAFVDVDLNGESGMDCAVVMTNLNPRLKVIFATAHSEYMAGAFEIYAFDYLVKPFDVERVRRTLSRLASELSTPDSGSRLLIKEREKVNFVNKEDIIFVERIGNSTNIVTSGQEYMTSAALGDIEKKLTEKNFMRCHKSYIINTELISKVEPYGRWTYIVRFRGTAKTALITAEKYERLKEQYS